MKRFNNRVLIIYIILIVFSLIKLIFKLDNNNIFNFYILPVIWIGLAYLVTKLLEDEKPRIRDKIGKAQTLFILAISYLIIYFFLGLIFGFEYSPYARDILSIFKNIWTFIVVIIFQEKIRCILVNYTSNKKKYFIFITFIFVFVNFNFNNFLVNSSSFKLFFKYLFSNFLPLFVENIIFTYLAVKCGFKSLMIFRVPVEFVYLIVPIFPRLDWFLSAIFSFIFNFIVFLIINYEYGMRNVSKRYRKSSHPLSYVPIFVLIILFISFVMGFFRYKPLAIVSNSMVPIFSRGDMVIIKKIASEDIHKLRINDIIEYRLDNHIVVHRIIKIEEHDGKLYFQTKGDNNNAPDTKFVPGENVLGVAKMYIPFVGYPTVWLSDLFSNDKPDVEMG